MKPLKQFIFEALLQFDKMQRIPQKQEPARSSSSSSLAGETMEGNRGRKSRYVLPSSSSSSPSPRPPPVCTCSNRPGSVSCISHGYAVPAEEKLRRNNNASKEVPRRALAPPIRRLSLRWLNFRPKPSRLSNMSVAQLACSSDLYVSLEAVHP